MGKSTRSRSQKSQDTDKLGTVTIDQDGDLTLSVGTRVVGLDEQPCKFKVDSSALRRTSAVFKAMLFGPWAESKPTDGSEWVVELPEDDPDGFQVILSIIHSAYYLIPTAMNKLLLYKILVLCDKYDMDQVLAPWAQSWLSAVADQAKHQFKEDKPSADPLMTFIAWHLGDETLYAEEVRKMILCSYLNPVEDGHLFVHCWRHDRNLSNEDHLGPPDLLERIAKIRLELITDILLHVRQEIEPRKEERPNPVYYGARATPTFNCKFDPQSFTYNFSNRDRRLCGDVILGGIWRRIMASPKLKLLDLEQPKAVCLDVASLLAACTDIFQGIQNLDRHEKCNPKEKFMVFVQNCKKGLAENGSFVEPEDRTRMAEQRKRFKVAGPD
ncbi:hypothetical protein QBC38DRAFT_417127 [Podospora fimiseda]|uniref:BTB domain-containing protein n=1 Tax=Podospora fimiseda TaxID=252190 RepID=A0AAN7H4N0_9PEZI|nr:hypothetical protein QBC38DRAFT_417127 [Podospora fimiseda]